MSALTRIAQRLGTADAISWPGFVLTFVAGAIGNVVTNPGPVGPGVRLVAVGFGQLVLWAPLWLVRRVLLGTPERPRPVLVVTVAACSLILRVVVLRWSLHALGSPDQASLPLVVFGAFTNIGLAFAVAGYVTSGMRERRRQVRRLKTIEAGLVAAADRMNADIQQRSEETVERVRAALVQQLSALDATDADGSLAALRGAVADVVRPLSHELAQAVPEVDVGPTASGDVTWSEVLDEAASGRPFRPWIVGLLLGAPLLGAARTYPAFAGALAVVVAVAVVLFGAANHLLSWWLVGRPRDVRIASVATAAAAVALVLGALVLLMLGSVRPVPSLALGIAVFATVYGLGASIVSALARDRDRVIGRLEASASSLERGIVRARQAQWLQSKSLSRALHGPVQMAFTAAAVRLDLAIRAGDAPTSLIERMRVDVLVALDVLHDADTSTGPLSQGVERVVGMWSGVCDVTVQVASGIEAIVEADTALRSCLVDLISEAITNAVRHGRAARAVVALDVDADVAGALRLSVDSDVRGSAESAGRGLGSRMLDEFTLSWTSEVVGSWHRLVASVPFR